MSELPKRRASLAARFRTEVEKALPMLRRQSIPENLRVFALFLPGCTDEESLSALAIYAGILERIATEPGGMEIWQEMRLSMIRSLGPQSSNE